MLAMATTAVLIDGERLRELRDAAGLSRGRLADLVKRRWTERLTLDRETIRQYEGGQIGLTRPNVVILMLIADVLECPLSEIAPGLV